MQNPEIMQSPSCPRDHAKLIPNRINQLQITTPQHYKNNVLWTTPDYMLCENYNKPRNCKPMLLIPMWSITTLMHLHVYIKAHNQFHTISQRVVSVINKPAVPSWPRLAARCAQDGRPDNMIKLIFCQANKPNSIVFTSKKWVGPVDNCQCPPTSVWLHRHRPNGRSPGWIPISVVPSLQCVIYICIYVLDQWKF